MQYNSKGSRNPEQIVPGQRSSRFITLNYIEVPILYHKKIGDKQVGSFECGMAYARLFGFQINENPNSVNYASFFDIQDDFNRNDLSLILGGGIFVTEHIRMMSRFSYSMILLYKNENPNFDFTNNAPDIINLRNMQLGFGINYIF